MSEGTFEVLWPLGRSTSKTLQMNPRLREGAAKRIGLVWDFMFRGDEMFSLMQPGLEESYPGSTFLPASTFGNVHGHNEREVIAALPGILRNQKVDAVVVGVGA
jgi:hypothetical protein